ncbi:MAG: hypothetical protein ACI94Y_002089 [Maribacter sp.]|jgi:hypothetical protein
MLLKKRIKEDMVEVMKNRNKKLKDISALRLMVFIIFQCIVNYELVYYEYH